MSYPQAIFGGLVMLAAVLMFGGTDAQTRTEGGPFEGVMSTRTGQAGDFIWRVNKQTGAVSICFGLNTREAPACSPWSQ